MRELIEEIAIAARESEFVDQTSGVSARVAISALEQLVSNLERRGAARPATTRSTRASATCHMLAAGDHRQGRDGLRGRAAGRRGRGAAAGRRGGQEAVRRALPRGRQGGAAAAARTTPARTRRSSSWFADGNAVDALGRAAVRRLRGRARAGAGPRRTWSREHGDDAARSAAFAAELVLEGLHQNLKLARHDLDSHGQLQGDAQVPAPQAAAQRPQRRRDRGRCD